MTTVKVFERKIYVDDSAIPLISGEVHYWRLDPHSWRDSLNRVREMGLNIVATYVCWDFHETAPGQYDFHGKTDPRRNLLGFLDLLTDMGFWIILRPGPYIYSEWSNNGAPDHAARFHRLAPEFLRLAEHYMAAVYQAVEKHLASRGGRIIVWQSDNEIDPWPHLYTEQMGIGTQVGMFHEYLRERYASVAALNQAWDSQFASIDDARAVTTIFPNDSRLLARYNDFREFLHWYVQKVAAWGIDTYRKLGVDVPILLNTYSGTGTQHWSNLEQIADIVGPDIYPSREFLNRGGNKEHRTVLEAVRYTEAYSRLPYIPEWQSGIWHDWLEDVGYLPANHYRMLCISALMAGSAGWNWYMLVNRDNWYQSPINEWGRVRPEVFAAFRQITHLFHEIDPATLRRVTRLALTFDPLQRATERPGQDLLHSFYLADIDYDFYDLSQDQPLHQPLLVYAGGRWLSAAGQRRLLAYVEGGGHLLFIGDYPYLDEHMRPLNLLNIHEPAGIVSSAPFNMEVSFNGDVVASQWVYHYPAALENPLRVTRQPVENVSSEELRLQFNVQTGSQYTVGYSEQRGAGRMTVIGMKPSAALLTSVLKQQGIVSASQSLTADVTSALLHREGVVYLMLTNTGNESKTAQVRLDPQIITPGMWTVHNLTSGENSTITISESGMVHVPVPRKDGAVLRFSPQQ